MSPSIALADIRHDLAEIAVYVSYVIDLSVAVWENDGAGAERVIEADHEIDSRSSLLVDRIAGAHTRWELPYAPHVRSLVAATVATVAIERTGDLAVEVAERGRRAGARPDGASAAVEALAKAGHSVADALGAAAAASRDADSVKALDASEKAAAARERQAEVHDIVWRLPVGDRTWATQALLSSRCLERAAANAAELAERVIWVEYGARTQAAA